MLRPSLSLVLLLGACGSPTETRGGNDWVTQVFAQGFSSAIMDAAGKKVGSAVGRPGNDGLVVAYEVSGMSPGRHAVHVHSVGRCDPPDFASAGPHWSQPGMEHGTDNPKGPHDGDWDNLDVGADGHGSTDRLIPRWHARIPPTGLSLVIHAGSDDEISQPEGNSGRRVACAVIVPAS